MFPFSGADQKVPMNERACAACGLADACTELLGVVDKNPKDILTHRCKKFCGISSGEQSVRNDLLETFGVNALASAIIQPKGVHVAYSVEQLEKLPRSPLRNIAEKFGLSQAKSAEKTVEELREFILSKQSGTKGKAKKAKGKGKGTKEAAEPEGDAGDPEEDSGRTRPGRVSYEDEPEGDPGEGDVLEATELEEEEQEEAPVTGNLEARIEKLESTIRALGNMMGDYVDIQKKHRRFERRAFAVLDRKSNCTLGSMDMIGAKVIGEDFDPMKCEESHSKKYKHTVGMGVIQKAVGDPVDVEEEEG